MFRNNNPDKGTETVSFTLSILDGRHKFRNNNPDKGTETFLIWMKVLHYLLFRNNNPDKGTETDIKPGLNRLYV